MSCSSLALLAGAIAAFAPRAHGAWLCDGLAAVGLDHVAALQRWSRCTARAGSASPEPAADQVCAILAGLGEGALELRQPRGGDDGEVGALGAVRGVPPAAAERYRVAAAGGSSIFRCFSGDTAEVPLAAVNDDFCDCADGSDEPGTSACAGAGSGIGGGCFFCLNDGASPRLLFASRVQDGVCDCCDGSDEAGGLADCPNRCAEEGAAAKEVRDLRRADVVEGLRLSREAAVDGTALVKSWREEVARIDADLPALRSAKEAARRTQDDLEAKMRAKKEAIAIVEAEAKVAADVVASPEFSVPESRAEQRLLSEHLFSDDFEDSEAAQRWSRAVGGDSRIEPDPLGSKGHVLSMNSCTWGGDAFSKASFRCTLQSPCIVSFWARGAPWQGFSCGDKRTEADVLDAHSWLAVPVAYTAGFEDRSVSTIVSEEWSYYEYEFPKEDAFQMFGNDEVTFSTRNVHIMLQAHASTGLCEHTMFDDVRVTRSSSGTRNGGLASSEDSQQTLVEQAVVGVEATTAPEVPKAEVSEYAKWALSQNDNADENFISDDPMEESLEIVRDVGSADQEDADLQLARSQATKADTDLRLAEQRKQRLESNLASNLGEGFRWISLLDNCSTFEAASNMYEVCYFKSAKQGHFHLGNFVGWAADDPYVMEFSNGDRCHAGPARSLRLRFHCGSDGELYSVSEPQRCVYEAHARHPGACSQTDLAELDAEERGLIRMPHDEL